MGWLRRLDRLLVEVDRTERAYHAGLGHSVRVQLLGGLSDQLVGEMRNPMAAGDVLPVSHG